MENDEFNDFQHPVSQQPSKSHQIPHQVEQQIKEQGGSFTNNFFNFDAKNINPPSSLATMTFQQMSENKDSKDFEDNNWPHLNRIHSENLPALQQNFIAFQKSHSQEEHKIDLFDFSNSFISEYKTVTNQDVNKKIQLATTQIPNTKLAQNNRSQQNFFFIDPLQTNSNQINHTLQNNLLGFQSDYLDKEQPTEQVKFSEQTEVMAEVNKNISNLQVQSDSIRKQSEQFVFAQPVQPVSFQANKTNQRKQSEQFVFYSQQKPLQPSFTQTASDFPELAILEQEQKLTNYAKKQQDQLDQPKISNQLTVISNQQENNMINPITVSQSVKIQEDLEDEQFGNFEETVPNVYTQSHNPTLGTQLKTENNQSIVQLYELQIPFGVDSSLKKKQLQELIDSLPKYNLLFINAFQSL